MQLITERLFLIPLQPDGMRALLARTTDPELSSPTPICWTFPSPTPSSGLVHRMGLYQNDSGDW